MKKFTLAGLLTIAIVFLLGSLTVVAASEGGHISGADFNGNGVIDKDEVIRVIRAYFSEENVSPPQPTVPPMAPRPASLPPAPLMDADPPTTPLTSTTEPRGNCALYNKQAGNEVEWLEKAYPDYSVCYTEEYASDMGQASHWLAEIRDWLFAKYDIDHLAVFEGDTTPGRSRGDMIPMALYIMLIPEPNQHAYAGFTQFRCCYDSGGDLGYNNGANNAYIPYLTPSSSNWRRYPTLGQLRTPPNQGHIKNLMHEFTHAVQRTAVELLCVRPEGCPHFGVPNWAWEGLAEYEGTFNTTLHNRTETSRKLVDYVAERDLIHLRTSLNYEQILRPSDTYFGGNLLMKFLADRFGEDIHYRLTHADAESLDEVLRAEYAGAGVTPFVLFGELQAWMAEQK